MEAEDQSPSLIKRIEQLDDTIDKLKREEDKLNAYIKEFKQAIEKKNGKEHENTKAHLDEDKAEKQLQRQLENAKNMLKNYQNQLKNLQKKNNKNKYTPEQLLNLDECIRKKENQLKDLNDEMKNLNIIKRKQQKLIEKKQKNQDGGKLSKLVQEVRKQKEILDSIKIKHQQKQEALEKRKIAIQEMEKAYFQKCKKNGEKPINFEEFKEKRSQRRKDESVQKTQQKKDPKKHYSIRDIINSHIEIGNIETTEKSLNELKQKRTVAENALKIAKKKNEKEIQELTSRLENLKKQNESLNQKTLEKKKEKEMIETSKGVDFKKSQSKMIKKLEPIK